MYIYIYCTYIHTYILAYKYTVHTPTYTYIHIEKTYVWNTEYPQVQEGLGWSTKGLKKLRSETVTFSL